MVYAIIILAIVVAVLAFAYLRERQEAQTQMKERQDLLEHYQRRVDEQEKVLTDFRDLEKNFENIGKGYEQALLMFDKLEEEKQRLEGANKTLVEQNEKLRGALQKAQTEAQELATKANDERDTFLKKALQEIKKELGASASPRTAILLGRLTDIYGLEEAAPQADGDGEITTRT